ncbi:MAG: hypothetical protein MI749_12550 [Desulfovibrionales bacterium]|nr:hypothetical protein [Desulfovibrionales bacterium]
MSEKNTQNTEAQKEKTVLQNILFGLVVWKKNITRMFSEILHTLELKQLEKRLEQEYAALGKATSHHLGGSDEMPATASVEMTSSLKQISFLKDELVRLKEEHAKSA